MRVPGNIEGTDKVYAAAGAALLVDQAHNRASAGLIEVVTLRAAGRTILSSYHPVAT